MEKDNFPILIKLVYEKRYMVCTSTETVPTGVPFKVVATKVEIK